MATLKLSFRVILGLILLVSTFSCLDEDNHGFSKKVEFPPEGGEITLRGDMSPISISFSDNETRWWDDPLDPTIEYIQNGWLTGSYPMGEGNEITIKAEPNLSGKERKQTLTMDFPMAIGYIKVVQHK